MKKKHIQIYALLILLFALTGSCKKEAGEGGNASIKGKIWVKDYNPNFTVLNGEYPGADEDVYIIYGDDISYGDRLRASPDGSFEFKYLRKGKYTVYVYSKDSTLTSPSLTTSVQVEASVSKNKETVDVGTIEIFE
ncbi:MAG: hypothetical protein KDD36_12520 [Flavobacteriales bacterium]|nr:hypothetical protein [Flavobacteriales bacterium]